MSSQDMKAPLNGHEDRGPAAVAVYWAQDGVAILIVLTGFYAQRMVRALGADD